MSLGRFCLVSQVQVKQIDEVGANTSVHLVDTAIGINDVDATGL